MPAERKQRTCPSCDEEYSSRRLCCPNCGEANDLIAERHASEGLFSMIPGLRDLDDTAKRLIVRVVALLFVLAILSYYLVLRNR